MPVQCGLFLVKGWKADENGRFGPAVVMRFLNSADNTVMFEFAPTLEHQSIFTKLFEDMYAIDDINSRHLKELNLLRVKQEKELGDLCDRLKLRSDPYFKSIAGESFKSAKDVGCKA